VPFTLSHAVVALPFLRSRLPAAGIAAGAVAPDLPLYVPVGVTYGTTHEAWAAPTVDVLLALVLLLLWTVVLRPALAAVLPPAVAERTPAGWDRPTVPRPTPALLGAIALGALTHVVWDAFTHPGRWGTVLLPGLDRTVAGVPLASWGQYAGSVLGLLLLAAWGWRRLARQERRPRSVVLPTAARRAVAAIAVVALLTGAGLTGFGARGSGVAAAVFAGAIGGIDAAGAVLLVVGAAVGARRMAS
jgi:hypothetical protein